MLIRMNILCYLRRMRALIDDSGFSLFTLGYNIYIVYRNIGIKLQIKGEKKEFNGFGRSVGWSEEFSF